MWIGACGELSLETFIGLTVVQSCRALPCFDLYQHLRQVAVRGRSADQRNMRRALKNLLPLLLSDAAQDAKLLALGQELFVIGQPVENFLLRFVADGAGVVEDQVGLLDRLYLAVTFMHQRANDFFGVVRVHLAAEGFQIESLLRSRGHKQSITRWRVSTQHSAPSILPEGVTDVKSTPRPRRERKPERLVALNF